MNFNITPEARKKLLDINTKTKINRSKLVRMFISYFFDNNDRLNELISGDYD